MQDGESQKESFEYDPNEFGEVQAVWEIDEFKEHARSRAWYIFASIIGIALIVYSVITSNFLFAVIVLMSAVIMLFSLTIKPDKISVMITETGIILGDMYYDYQSVRDFSVVYDPPDVKYLYLDFHARSHPMLSIPLEDTDPNHVRECLLPFCMENLHRNEETLTDLVRRLYKL